MSQTNVATFWDIQIRIILILHKVRRVVVHPVVHIIIIVPFYRRQYLMSRFIHDTGV
jgi:hypothetical protein